MSAMSDAAEAAARLRTVIDDLAGHARAGTRPTGTVQLDSADIRIVLDALESHQRDYRPGPFARLYFNYDELKGMADLLDRTIDRQDEGFGLLNSLRTAFREAQNWTPQ